MKKYVMFLFAVMFVAASLSACGSGGGSSASSATSSTSSASTTTSSTTTAATVSAPNYTMTITKSSVQKTTLKSADVGVFTASFVSVPSATPKIVSTCTAATGKTAPTGISSTDMTAGADTKTFTHSMTAGTGDGTCTVSISVSGTADTVTQVNGATATSVSYTVDNTADGKPSMNGDATFQCYAQTCSIPGTNVSGSTIEVSENSGTTWTSTGVTYPTATTFAYSITFTGSGIGKWVIARQTDPAGNVSASSTSISATGGY